MSGPPESLTCVECGGTAHLISFLAPDEPPDPETPLAYRCSDCMERFDVIWGENGDWWGERGTNSPSGAP